MEAEGEIRYAPTREQVGVPRQLRWSSGLPPAEPLRKLPVPGVPTNQETRLVDAEYTRFRRRSKYRAWA
jgi:hypothetical protein